MGIYKTSLLHRSNGCIGFTPDTTPSRGYWAGGQAILDGRGQNCYIVEPEPEIRGSGSTEVVCGRDGTGSGVDSGRFCVFLSDLDPDPESKFGKQRTRAWSHFSICAVAGVCVVMSLVKTSEIYGWVDDCSRSLNRGRILKFEKCPDPDSKIFWQEQSRILKKWLQPPLVCGASELYK